MPGDYRIWLAFGLAMVALASHPWVLAWLMVRDPDMVQRRAWADTVLPRHPMLPAIDASGRPTQIAYLDVERAVPGPCSRETDAWELETRGRRGHLIDVFAPRVTHVCRYRAVASQGRQAFVAIRIERWPYAPPPGSHQQPHIVKAEALPDALALIGRQNNGRGSREHEACAHVPSLHPHHPAFHRVPPARDIWNEPSGASNRPSGPARDECRP